MSWVTEGRIQNPAATTVLAQTPVFPEAGAFSAILLVSSSTNNAEVVLERVNNVGAVVQSHVMDLSVDTVTIQLPNLEYTAGERFRVSNNKTLAGGNKLQVSMFY